MTFPTVYNPKRRGSRPKYGNKKVTVDGIKFDSISSLGIEYLFIVYFLIFIIYLNIISLKIIFY